jgi:hypothetical protein
VKGAGEKERDGREALFSKMEKEETEEKKSNRYNHTYLI